MKRILITVAITVSLLSGGFITRAADETSSKPVATDAAKKPKQMPFYGSVKAVDLKAKTLTLVGKEKDRVFLVTDSTRIHDSGANKKLEDVQVGRKVGGLAKANASGKWEVATLNLGVKQQRSARTSSKVDETSTE